jgi:exonuclease VII small subunit
VALTSGKNQGSDELTETPRERKLKKRKYPRPRVLVQKEGKKLAIESSKRNELEKASERIKKHLQEFPNLDSVEGRNQRESYLEWILASLEQGQLSLKDDDIEYKTAVSSVSAGGQHQQKTRSSIRALHKPSKIAVRNEEERSLEQNKEAANKNLVKRLTDHLSLWQTLLRNSPETTLSEIKSRGINIFRELGLENA